MLAVSLADVRDYILIIFFGAGTVLVVFSLIVGYLVFRKFGSLLDAARGNLDSTKTTLGNAAAASTVITDFITKPVITTASVFAGMKQGLGFLMKLAIRRGGG